MTLLYDIETKWFGNFDVQEDELRTISMYELEVEQWHFFTYKQLKEIQDLFNKHNIIIGFNNWNYDDPIIKKAGVDLRYHNNIDLLEVSKKRGDYIGLENSNLSLKNIALNLGLDELKDDDFDYDLLLKDDWSKEELELIKNYNEQDVKVTTALFNKLHSFFLPFKEFVSDVDKNNLSWLKSSVATYTYKVMCHQTGISEEYDDSTTHKGYEGGFVAEPTCDEAHNNIYCLDFNSLYPHMYIMGNLASRSFDGWNGSGFFDLKGTYNNVSQGLMEKTLFDLYKKRVAYKKEKNPLQHALKIVMNTFYGCTGNPVFKNLYNFNTAQDCTSMGRKCIQYTREVFEAYGYKFLYTDTDSVYIQDPFKDEDKLMMVKDKIISNIKSHVPFPVSTFDLGVDYRIKHIWFFKSNDHFLKKNYVLVTEDEELVIKGLPLIRCDGSGIGLYIFNKYMRSDVLNGQLKHSYKEIKKVVSEELERDLELVKKRFIVGKAENYKLKTQIQRKISEKYGPGKHYLIPNKFVGVGNKVKYCTQKEYEDKGYSIHGLILNKMWNELRFFLDEEPREEKSFKGKNQSELLRWTNI